MLGLITPVSSVNFHSSLGPGGLIVPLILADTESNAQRGHILGGEEPDQYKNLTSGPYHALASTT